MSNISDIIEKFIMDAIGNENTLEISRNSLAEYFDCAPSQINYVLDTRFTLDRGFSIDSKRGGGGFIKITRLSPQKDEMAIMVLENVGDELSFRRMNQILLRLKQEKIVTAREVSLIKSVLSDEALSLPLLVKDKLRANCFKNMLIQLMKGDNN